MKEHPILFSAPMVRALLEGRKTQTRRAVKGVALDWLESANFTPGYVALQENGLCRYGYAGDRLWVRETWANIGEPKAPIYAYRADTADGERVRVDAPWKPSIHMPRRACRLVLEVTGVRVERLQAISETDAIAEGIERSDTYPNELWKRGPLRRDVRPTPWTGFPKLAFQSLWEGINGTESWDANPWVWVLTFRRLEPAHG